MLTVSMKSFRHHKALTVTLREGITHLRGKNGVGKSTVAAAILWALYGTLRNVAPSATPNAKTHVTLTYEAEDATVVITRSKGNRLTCREGDTVYDGITAQAIINNRFGTEMEWMNRCYIPQQRSHILVGASTSDCLSLFHMLKYKGETPENVSSIVDTLRGTLTTLCKQRDVLLSQVGQSTYTDHICPAIEKPDVEGRTMALAATVSRLSTVSTTLFSLHQQEETLSSLLTLPDLNILSLRREEVIAKKCVETTARRATIEAELSVPVAHSREELLSMKRLYEVYQKGIDVVTKYRLEYSTESIKERRAELTEKINNAIAAKDRQERRLRLIKELDTVSSASEEELVTINKHIQQTTTRYTELKSIITTPEGTPCPHCNKLIVINNGKLIKGGENVETLYKLKQEFKTISASLDKANKTATSLTRSLTTKNAVQQELVSLPEEEIVSDVDLSDWRLEMSDLSRVIVVDKPILSVVDIVSSIRQIDLREELKSLPASVRRLEEIQADITTTEKRLQLCQKFLQQSNVKIHSQLTNSLLQSIRDEIATLEEEKKILLSKQSTEETMLASDKKMMAEWHKHNLCHVHREIQEYRRRIDNFTKAIDITNRTYQEGLEETIGTVNSLLAEVCSRMYEKDLVLRFLLIKAGEEVEGRVRRKSSISLMASIDGDDRCVSDISGGEFSRASLCLLLTMVIHTSPLFLMLDEPFSGVPEDLQDVFMELLKQYLPHTPVLLILHGNVGSSIDSVLHLTDSGLH